MRMMNFLIIISSCFLLCACQGKDKNEVSVANGYYELTIEGKWLVAMMDVKRILITKEGLTKTTFEVIGPIAIVELKGPDSDWDGVFSKQKTGGVWETREGRLESGKIYFVKRGQKPIFLSVIPQRTNKVELKGKWSSETGCALFLSDIFKRSDKNDPLRVKLVRAFK